MTDMLYLHLTSADPNTPVNALLVDAEGGVQMSATSASLAELASRLKDVAVTLLIPGDEALSTVAELPKMGTAQARRSLPFALEEVIAGEIDRQHFAMGRLESATRPADGTIKSRIPAVVIERGRLESYLATARAAGFEPDHCYLDESCVAGKPGDVTVWIVGDEAFFRAPCGEALRVRTRDLATAVDLLPTEPPLSTLGVQVFGDDESSVGEIIESATRTHRFARVQRGASRPVLEWLVSQIDLARPVDLLQGPYASRRGRWSLPSRWRLPIALAAGLLLLHVADRVWVWQSADAERARLDNEISAVAPDVLAAPTESRAEKGRTTGLSVLRGVLTDLALVAPASSIETLVLDGTVTRVTFKGGVDAAEIVRRLTERGWQIVVGQDGEARTTLTIRQSSGSQS